MTARPDRLDRRLEGLRPFVGATLPGGCRPMPGPEVIRALLLRIYGDRGREATVEALMSISTESDRRFAEQLVDEVAEAWAAMA